MAQQDQVEELYQVQDAVGSTIKATLITGTAGTFVSAIQNVLAKQNVGAFGVFTRTGGTIAVFGKSSRGRGCNGRERVILTGELIAAAGGAYEFTKTASANLRQKNDAYNSAIGGFFGGSMLGLRCTLSCVTPGLEDDLLTAA